MLSWITVDTHDFISIGILRAVFCISLFSFRQAFTTITYRDSFSNGEGSCDWHPVYGVTINKYADVFNTRKHLARPLGGVVLLKWLQTE